ncbi:ribosome assembly cofactor RimP [Leptobacterium sp. I13]|uniref:ribosome assembly cofactor RimP n=1 Tax=Leptobacterium meishanense TaxID=3128904 RepID=UPI0030EBE05E
MALKEKLLSILDEIFKKNESLFLIDYIVSPDNKICITIDGDEGVTLNDCITVSREIEQNLDREEEDFSLEVMSPGATEPIKQERQYKKNIGKQLKIKTLDDGAYEGELTAVAPEGIKIKWKTREPKPIGKGKITVEKEKELSFATILEAKVKIKF